MKILRYRDSAGRLRHGYRGAGNAVFELDGDIFGEFSPSERRADAGKILAPLIPNQIFCIGLNYRQHAEETGAKIPQFPVVFTKSPSSVQSPGDPISLPTKLKSDEVDYECELAVIIGRTCKNVSRDRALEHVLGYCCANDVSARDWQRRGSQWCRSKSFDTFCPLGPHLVTADEIPNPNALGISTILNGEVVQNANTGGMIFDVPALIEFLSGSATLPAGTVILTGTPSGVGMARVPPRWLQGGDVVTIRIEGIGELTNPVEYEA